MANIGNIKVKGLKKDKPKLENDGLMLPFYQTKNSLKNLDNFNKFIKNVETLVRDNDRYSGYIAYLRDLGFNYCQVHPNIETNEKNKHVKLEMHHGTILTLYDICSIVTTALLERGETVTSYRVASIVLEEHEKLHIQTVMLCENCHKAIHSGNSVYINPKQCFGDIAAFLEEWRDGIDEDMEIIINKNLELARKHNSSDNGALDATSGTIWGDR